MADPFVGYVRRIDLEPKFDYLGYRTYAHVFLTARDGGDPVDVYTDDPRFEAAFLTALSTAGTLPLQCEVTYEKAGNDNAKKVTRVALDHPNSEAERSAES